MRDNFIMDGKIQYTAKKTDINAIIVVAFVL